jgi:ribosomal protein S18 acetylase RimI-like enzyme
LIQVKRHGAARRCAESLIVPASRFVGNPVSPLCGSAARRPPAAGGEWFGEQEFGGCRNLAYIPVPEGVFGAQSVGKRADTTSAKGKGNAGDAPRPRVRGAQAADLDQVIDIDARVTGLRKREYWAEILRRYGGGRAQRFFLVADSSARIEGYVVGDVRDWEFGSPPCGWVFGIAVRPDARQGGIATQLLDSISEGFRRHGVTKVRTLLARNNHLVLSFFRSQGMMAAPFIALERDLD